jgi:hypothetical protein
MSREGAEAVTIGKKKLTPLDPREIWHEAPAEKEKKARRKFGGQLGLR